MGTRGALVGVDGQLGEPGQGARKTWGLGGSEGADDQLGEPGRGLSAGADEESSEAPARSFWG